MTSSRYLILLSLVAFLPCGGCKRTPDTSTSGIREEAQRGNVEAQFRLGSIYAQGQGVAQDSTEAVKWYRKAAEQGHGIASLVLSNCYMNGKGVPRDDKEAAKWLRKAAEQGNANGQILLGQCYSGGRLGASKDSTEAAKWFRKAAEQGHAEGQKLLGSLYSLGKGVPQDNMEAAKWLRKAAEQGHAKAQLILMSLYTEESIKGLVPKFEDGGVVYVFPETQSRKQLFKGFKDIQVKQNNKIAKAGLDPVSTLLMVLAGLALNSQRSGNSKQKTKDDVKKRINESRFTDKQKAGIESKILELIDQSYEYERIRAERANEAVVPAPEEAGTEEGAPAMKKQYHVSIQLGTRMDRYEIAVETVSAESAEDACRSAVRNFAGRCRPVIIPDPEIKLEQLEKELDELEGRISLAKNAKEKQVLEIRTLQRRAENIEEQLYDLHQIITPPLF